MVDRTGKLSFATATGAVLFAKQVVAAQGNDDPAPSVRSLRVLPAAPGSPICHVLLLTAAGQLIALCNVDLPALAQAAAARDADALRGLRAAMVTRVADAAAAQCGVPLAMAAETTACGVRVAVAGEGGAALTVWRMRGDGELVLEVRRSAHTHTHAAPRLTHLRHARACAWGA